METVDDLFYLKDEYGDGRCLRWHIKGDVLQQFDNSLIPGDIVYFEYYNAKYKVSDLELYLTSIGCTRTKKIALATKIVNSWNYTLTNYFRRVDKPKEVSREFGLRFKSVYWSKLESDIVTYTESQRTRIEFDYSMYENFWNLLKSGKRDDVRLAAIGIMTADWTGNEFLLRFLIINFSSNIRNGNLSTIPGWSDFANRLRLTWKNHTQYAYDLIHLFKDCIISQEHTTLINKLLNNN